MPKNPSDTAPQGHAGPVPQIRISDLVAYGAQAGLRAGSDRLVEFTLRELARLSELMGGDGMIALCAYLSVLRRDQAPDGGIMLVVDDFSGRWLQQNTSLSKNGSYRAQRALIESGLFSAIVSQPGAGARGMQRAVMNPNLVLIQGGKAGDATSLVRANRIPASRSLQNRESGEVGGAARFPGNWESGEAVHDSRSPGNWESGNDSGSNWANADGSRNAGNRETGRTRSSSVVGELLGHNGNAGLLQVALAPERADGPARVRRALRAVLNDSGAANRATELAASCGYDGPNSGLADFVADLCLELLCGGRDAVDFLAEIGVVGSPWGDEVGAALARRVVVGMLTGLGTKRIESWAAWMFRATDPGRAMQPNVLTRRLAEKLRAVDAPPAVIPVNVASDRNESPAGGPPPSEPADTVVAVSGSRLSDDDVARFLPDVVKAMPFLPRRKLEEDPVFRRAIVAEFLDGLEHRKRA